jgi:hypothetical protein
MLERVRVQRQRLSMGGNDSGWRQGWERMGGKIELLGLGHVQRLVVSHLRANELAETHRHPVSAAQCVVPL